MDKAQETKLFILDNALSLSRKIGFESISIGELAKKVGMSKSGLFAHFNSKETLHLMIMDHAASEFAKQVTKKSIKKPRGLERLRTMIDNWITWSTESGGSCPIVAAAIEFDDRPGKVQDSVSQHLQGLHEVMKRACEICVEEGHFKANTDCDQAAQEIFSYVLSYHLYKKTLKHKNAKKRFLSSIDALIERNLKRD